MFASLPAHSNSIFAGMGGITENYSSLDFLEVNILFYVDDLQTLYFEIISIYKTKVWHLL